MIRRASVALSLLALSACADGATARVEGPDGEVRLDVCLVAEARTAEERMRGLRGHDPLARDEGLLITFPVEGEVCIVNDGVTYAIDAVFADAAGQVVAVERDVPAADGTTRCHPNTARVLEVRAGVAARVSVSDRLTDSY